MRILTYVNKNKKKIQKILVLSKLYKQVFLKLIFIITHLAET